MGGESNNLPGRARWRRTAAGLFWHHTDGVLMSGFLGGMITGSLIGVVVTLLVLIIVAGAKGPENAPVGPVPNRKVFLLPLGCCLAAGFVTHSSRTQSLCSPFSQSRN